MNKVDHLGDRKRRSRGEGGVRWSDKRQRFIAEKVVGYNASGKRIVRSGSGRSSLRRCATCVRRFVSMRRGSGPMRVVTRSLRPWRPGSMYGQSRRAGEATRTKNGHLCETHIVNVIGEAKLQRSGWRISTCGLKAAPST